MSTGWRRSPLRLLTKLRVPSLGADGHLSRDLPRRARLAGDLGGHPDRRPAPGRGAWPAPAGSISREFAAARMERPANHARFSTMKPSGPSSSVLVVVMQEEGRGAQADPAVGNPDVEDRLGVGSATWSHRPIPASACCEPRAIAEANGRRSPGRAGPPDPPGRPAATSIPASAKATANDSPTRPPPTIRTSAFNTAMAWAALGRRSAARPHLRFCPIRRCRSHGRTIARRSPLVQEPLKRPALPNK